MVGLSVGAYCTAQFAIAHPGRVLGIVLAGQRGRLGACGVARDLQGLDLLRQLAGGLGGGTVGLSLGVALLRQLRDLRLLASKSLGMPLPRRMGWLGRWFGKSSAASPMSSQA